MNRTLPLTRIVAGIVVPVLTLAFIILYFFPDRSGQHFAWAIAPHMTARYMGAGYLGGAVLLAAAALGRPWHSVKTGFPVITVFTTSMLIDTILHWDRFDPSHFPFQLWLGLYVVTPFLIPYIWLRNRAEDPGKPAPGERIVPTPARQAMRISGLAFAVFSLLGFVFPETLIRIWVWPLSPLTARILAGWFALLAAGGVLIGREPRWGAWKTGLASIFTWHALVLLAAFLDPADFGASGLINWFLVLVFFGLAGMVGLFFWMESPRAPRFSES